MTLINNVSGDMSSLVRKELVKALQWFVLVFEHAFLNVANQESTVQDVTKTPTGMGRVASRFASLLFEDKITMKLNILGIV